MSISAMKLALILLISYMGITSACRCIPHHPQKQFCYSEYVIKGTPVKMREEDVYHVYTFENLTFYKSKDTAEFRTNTDAIDIYTLNDEGGCGTSFALNNEYIITGKMYKNKLNVDLCGFNKKWNSLTDIQINGFVDIYKLGCSCDILRMEDVRNDEDNPNRCLMENDFTHIFCYFKHSVCLKTNKGCEFTRSNDLTECFDSE